MSRVEANEAQLRAIEAPGSVVVTAGAGTGKTMMLALRYLEHLKRGLRPTQVVAVTFTRKAAQELRHRVRRVVSEALESDPSWGDADLLAEIEAAPIGTIHSLAQGICRRYPEEAEVTPGFRVIDPSELDVWQNEALDEVLAELDHGIFEGIGYDHVRELLRAIVEDPYRSSRALEVDPRKLRQTIDRMRQRSYHETLRNPDWDHALAQLRATAGPEFHPAEVNRRLALRCAEDIAAAGPESAPTAASWAALAGIKPSGGNQKEWSGKDLPTLKAALARLRDLARLAWDDGRGPIGYRWTPRDQLVAAAIEKLRTSFSEILTRLDRRKRERGLLTFADLETHALRALSHPRVRDHLHSNWQALLLDEAQDTNPAQARLLSKLVAAAAPITVVGDQKQSIYAFRGAEPRLFDLARRRIAQRGGLEVQLSANYRSQPELVDRVNDFFDRVLAHEAAPLEAERPPVTLPGPALEVLRLAPGGSVDRSQRASFEAAEIAQRIAALLQPGSPYQIAERAGLRPLRLDDIAILARNHTTLNTLEAYLPGLGIPVVNAGGGALLETREALDVRAMLRAILDPNDAQALTALLRSPYVAASDPEISRFARESITNRLEPGAAKKWWLRLDQATAGSGLARAAALLRELREARAAGATAVELVMLADERSALRAVLANLPNGSRRLADHDGMLELLGGVTRGRSDALKSVRDLERLFRSGSKVERPPLRVAGAVTLMTIHGSKGLEWPVVILANLAAVGQRSEPPLIVDAKLGFALNMQARGADEEPPTLYTIARKRQREGEAAELKRLLYVALTRARDLMILSDRGARKGGFRPLVDEGGAAAGVPVTEVVVDAAAFLPPPPPPLPPAPDPNDRLWRPLPSVASDG